MALTATEVIEQAIARWLNCHGIDVLDALERAGYHIAKPGQAVSADGVLCDLVPVFDREWLYRLVPVDGAS